MDVGQRIREAREDLGMQQTVLARRVGVSRNTIGRYESGDRAPSLTMVEKIARELRTEPAELLREPVPFAKAPDQGSASPGRTSRTKVPEIRVPRVGTRRAKASRNRTPELLLEQLHEHGIQTNLSEVSILSQIIGISDELVEEEPLEWEQIGWLLAYTLAYDMLTQDEIEAARAALRRKVVESA
jgi:transcriptional regulator with XRE-family HTH domain